MDTFAARVPKQKADTFVFLDERQVAKIKVRRGQSVVVLGAKGAMVRDPGPGMFEVDVVKLKSLSPGEEGPFPLAVLVIPTEHSFQWAALSAERASFLLAGLLKGISTVH